MVTLSSGIESIMCWALSLTISLIKDTEARRAKLNAFLDDQELSFAGSYPQYFVSNGHCGCSLVQRRGDRLSHQALELISSLLELSEVRAVEVSWFKGVKQTVKRVEVSLNISDFMRYNVQGGLADKTYLLPK